MAPSPAQIYSRVVEGLEPAAAAAGMMRVRTVSFPAWRKRLEEPFSIFLTAQVDRKATDSYSGAQFRLEVEKTASSRPNAGLMGRALFFQLLTSNELSRVLAQQNAIIASLSAPPPEQRALYPEGAVRDMYDSHFAPQAAFDAVRCWLRVPTLNVVDAWVHTFSPLIPVLIDRAESRLDPAVVHLGQGSLL